MCKLCISWHTFAYAIASFNYSLYFCDAKAHRIIVFAFCFVTFCNMQVCMYVLQRQHEHIYVYAAYFSTYFDKFHIFCAYYASKQNAYFGKNLCYEPDP